MLSQGGTIRGGERRYHRAAPSEEESGGIIGRHHQRRSGGIIGRHHQWRRAVVRCNTRHRALSCWQCMNNIRRADNPNL